LFVGIGLIIGRSVQKRPKNGIGTQIMHIPQRGRHLLGGSRSIK
jgi:hypothetical protein